MGTDKFCNSEKNVKSVLTEKPQGASLKNVPDATNTRHNIKQTNGGNVQNTKPPTMRGFFMPATQPGDCTKLSGVARNKTPPSGNTCSVSFRTLNGSRQLLNCPNIKQTNEANAMQGNNQGIATPVANVQGYTPTLQTPPEQALIDAIRANCLFSKTLLLETLLHAKQQRATTGKANAYAELLHHFHRAILPVILDACDNNWSETARVTGLHRETLQRYAAQVLGGAA